MTTPVILAGKPNPRGLKTMVDYLVYVGGEDFVQCNFRQAQRVVDQRRVVESVMGERHVITVLHDDGILLKLKWGNTK